MLAKYDVITIVA